MDYDAVTKEQLVSWLNVAMEEYCSHNCDGSCRLPWKSICRLQGEAKALVDDYRHERWMASMKRASEIVESWPEWKRSINIGRSQS